MKTQPPLADKGPRRNPAKEHAWRQHLKQFAGSGQTVRAFCAAHSLSEPAFYFWRSELRRRDGQASPRRQHAKRRPARPLAFARVLVEAPAMNDALRLRLGCGRELLLPTSMAPEQVAKLIRAIEATS
jgi:hypothetical protein